MLHLNLSDTQVALFEKFEEILLQWNSAMNLTRITDEEDIINKHFIDSLCIVNADEFLDHDLNSSINVLDMGSGAGFPGIPIKIMWPEIRLTLVDSLEKRVRFLRRMIDELGLRDTYAVHSRAEDFGDMPGRRGHYDVCVARAVAGLSVLAEYTLPFVKNGGQCVYYKGLEVEDEIQNAKRAFTLLGGKYPVHTVKYNLPDVDIGRSLVIVNKVSDTLDYYPRKAGTPARSPIS